jgi:hypothetical protein
MESKLIDLNFEDIGKTKKNLNFELEEDSEQS